MPLIWPDPFQDDFETRYVFFMAAGRSVRDCAIIGHRFHVEEGFRWDASESWLIRVQPSGDGGVFQNIRLALGGPTWLTRVWMSPANRFWATSADGEVHEETDAGGLRTHRLDGPLSGVWGLSDRCVYAWNEARERLWRWDGARWSELPCPGRLLVLAGTGPDDLVAGGYFGDVWRWNGQAWSDVGLGLDGAVAGLRMTAPDRTYATTLAGEVVEISPYGAQLLARWGGPLLDVTSLGGDLLLGAGSEGLLSATAGTSRIDPVTTDFVPERFDERDGVVLISAGRGILETTDGKDFTPGLSAGWLRDQREQDPPLW